MTVLAQDQNEQKDYEIVRYVFYEVTGKSLRDIARDESQKGPIGYAGYTGATYWTDPGCKVGFHAKITMPKLGKEAKENLNDGELAEFSRFYDALHGHELNHLAMIRFYVRDVMAADCVGWEEIRDYWVEQSQLYDVETNYGGSEGAQLRRPGFLSRVQRAFGSITGG